MNPTTTKVIGVGLIIAGLVIVAKKHKNPGFWSGFGSAFLTSWGIGVLLKK